MKKSFPLFLLLALIVFATSAFAEDKKPAPVPAPAPAATPAPSAPATSPAPTAAPTTDQVPDTSNMLFIQNLRKAGTTIYYLGDALGLHGWFAVKDGQIQIFYTTPDQRAIIVGALLSAEGANISQQQVLLLANSKPEIQQILKGQQAAANAASNASAPSPESADKSEQFMGELLKGATLTFGKPTAPQLVMIMDVRCHFCHATWKLLQPLVDAGKLRVTMFPIMALGTESRDKAAVWLAQKDPYDAWKKHVGGDEKVLSSPPPADKVQAIANNTGLVQKWHVDQTPYLLYRGKNNKVRLIIGQPQSADVIMNDIGG